MYFLILDFVPDKPSNPTILKDGETIHFFEDLQDIELYIENNGVSNYFIGIYDEEFMDIESLKYIQDVPTRE